MDEKNNVKIGVLGGMGPAASCLFYKMVTEKTEAYKDQDHINMLIYSDASMPDRTEAILGKHVNEVADKMLDDISWMISGFLREPDVRQFLSHVIRLIFLSICCLIRLKSQ